MEAGRVHRCVALSERRPPDYLYAMAKKTKPTKTQDKKKPVGRRRKTVFSGVRKTWTRNPAEKVIDSGKAYDRRKARRDERRARDEADPS